MKKSLLVGALLVSTLSFGQKKNVTSAAVEFLNKYVPAMKAKNYDQAKKSLTSAKGFIDLAVAHPDTKENPKAHYYKGQIYYAATGLAVLAEDPAFLKTFGENDAVLDMSIEAYKYSYSLGKKYKSDVKDAALNARGEFDIKANEAYTAEDFKSASELYNWRAKFLAVIGEMDSSAIFNSAFCAGKADNNELAATNYLRCAEAGYKGAMSYNLASGAYRNMGNIEKAKEIVNAGRVIYPNDRDLLLELVNINIDANDPAGAEAALASAIDADPNNKQLFYTIGTIYIELKENEKAELALKKALEIDPEYMDAYYQLGAHLVSWGGDLKTEANNLKLGDAQYDVLLSQSSEVYGRAVAPLETYINKSPDDKDVLKILSQLHRSLGNSEKSAEYKKRAAEAK